MLPLIRVGGTFDLHLEKDFYNSTAPPASSEDNYEEVLAEDLDNFIMVAGISRGWRVFLTVGLELLGKAGVPTQALTEALFLAPDSTPKDELIASTFKTADNFSRAVIEIKEGWQDTTPETALKTGLGWVYRNHRKSAQKKDPLPTLNISARDIEVLKARYNFTNDQLFNVLLEIHQNYGWLYKFMGEEMQYRDIWENIYSAIANSETSAPLNQELLGTQELLRKGFDELKVLDEQITKVLYEKIIRKLSAIDDLGVEPAEITLGNERLIIRDPKTALEKMYAVLKTIGEGKKMAPEEAAFVENLKADDEGIRRIYDAATRPAKDRIIGRDNFIKLIHLSESGGVLGKGLCSFIEKISTGRETVLLIVQNKAGRQIMPRRVVRSLGNGERFAHYERPYYVGPFSYHFGKVFTVKGDKVSEETAVVAMDGRGKEFFITHRDMQHLAELARSLGSRKNGRSELAKAVFKFFNAAQAIYLSVDPTYKPAEGSPADIAQRADFLRKINWVGRFEREADKVLEDFFNVMARSLGNRFDSENKFSEVMEIKLHERLSALSREYSKYYGKTRTKEFESALRLLERGIILKSAEKIEEAMGSLKRLSTAQLSGSKAGTAWLRAQDIASEMRFLRDILPEMLVKYESGGEEAPPAIRNFVLIWGTSSDMEPNLKMARQLMKDGSLERAFAEYEKIIRSSKTSTEMRFAALSELAGGTYSAGQILRTGRALEQIDNMMLVGRKLTGTARNTLQQLLTRATKSDPLLRLEIPANLKKEVFGGSLTKPFPAKMNKRFEGLPEAVRTEVQRVIEKWGSEDLLGYRLEFLRAVAMCRHEGEAVRLADIRNAEEMELFKRFRAEVLEAIGPFGYHRYLQLPKEARKNLEKLIASWGEGKGSGKPALRAAALATEAEVSKVDGAYGLRSEIDDFRRISKNIVDPAQFDRAGPEEIRPVKVIERSDVKLPEGVYEGLETSVDGQIVKPWYVSHGAKTYMVVRDIGGPALFGAATFLTAEQAVSLIVGPPKTHMEAFVYQYDVVGAAVLMEGGLQKLAEYIARGGTNYPAVPAAAAGYSLSGFVGGLGASVFVYKGINEIALTAGLSGRPAEIASLVGTGVVLGSWQPAIKKIYGEAKGSKIIKSAGRAITRGGTILFAADAAPTAFEAVYNLFDDEASIVAREKWYSCVKETGYQRGIFGSAEDVAWYERVVQSVYNGLDDIFVPASWHKMAGPALDKVAAGWITNCEKSLANGNDCYCSY